MFFRTFDSISLAFFVDSGNAKLILDEMERALSQDRFADTLHYARTAVKYHINLLREQMNLPQVLDSLDGYEEIGKDIGRKFQSQNSFNPRHTTSMNIGDRYFRSLNEIIGWIVDRLVLPEHHHDLKELFPDESSEYYILQHEKEPANRQKAERARQLAYKIMIDTQWQLRQKKDSDHPVIFDSQFVTDENNKIHLQLGIASVSELSEVTLTIFHSNNRKEELNIEKQIGLQRIMLKTISTRCRCEVSVKNVSSVRKISQDIMV